MPLPPITHVKQEVFVTIFKVEVCYNVIGFSIVGILLDDLSIGADLSEAIILVNVSKLIKVYIIVYLIKALGTTDTGIAFLIGSLLLLLEEHLHLWD